ncbi:MAG: ribulose-phosphate 3-epimerase [Coriobacteriia bacterium]|nr:ribulose-phosphate 3-epimerase [Coriobacteriia bacterium]
MTDSVQTSPVIGAPLLGAQLPGALLPGALLHISPSLLSADFMNLERDIQLIEQGAPEWLHVDVMDGHFVPNLTIGAPVIKALKTITTIPLDVHLMIDNPERQLDWYIEAGADLLTIHLECAGDLENISPNPGTSIAIAELAKPDLIHSLIARIKAAGRKAGLAINPDTPVELVLPFIELVDLVMIMSVHPGFGGQSFMMESLDKLRLISNSSVDKNPRLLIEIDGGINVSTAPLAVAAGANMLVAGNAIFGDPDPLSAMAAIRAAAVGAAAGEAQTNQV